jgi:predicted transposase/invertase (TIGR01784 family)
MPMYDNVCKYLAETFTFDLATWLLGSPPSEQLHPLKTELSNEQIRTDSLILLESSDLVLHIEFQTEPDAKMPFRMTDYRLRVYRSFPNREMHQVVIYLKPSPSPLVQQTCFSLSRTRHEFEVIRLWEQPTDLFLNAPGLLAFAPLSRTTDPASVLDQVAQRIQALPERQIKSNVAGCAAILSGLVLNQELIHRILRQDVMKESVIYQEILQEGIQQGIQQGMQQGVAQVALNLLRSGMDIAQVAKLTELSVEQVQSLQASIQ